MKRKIFSKLLMGALLIASVSSFVSCKDYDDDINDLRSQIQGNATTLNQLVDQKISNANAEIATLKSQISSLESAYKAADDVVKAQITSATSQALADAKTYAGQLSDQAKSYAEVQAAAAQKAAIEAAQAQLSEAVAKLQGGIDAANTLINANKENINALLEADKVLTQNINAAQARANEAYTLAEQANDLAKKNQANISANASAIAAIQTQLQSMATDATVTALNSELTKVKENLEAAAKSNEASIADLKSAIAGVQEVVAALSKEQTILNEKVTALQQTSASNVAKIEAIQAQLASLQASNDAVIAAVGANGSKFTDLTKAVEDNNEAIKLLVNTKVDELTELTNKAMSMSAANQALIDGILEALGGETAASLKAYTDSKETTLLEAINAKTAAAQAAAEAAAAAQILALQGEIATKNAQIDGDLAAIKAFLGDLEGETLAEKLAAFATSEAMTSDVQALKAQMNEIYKALLGFEDDDEAADNDTPESTKTVTIADKMKALVAKVNELEATVAAYAALTSTVTGNMTAAYEMVTSVSIVPTHHTSAGVDNEPELQFTTANENATFNWPAAADNKLSFKAGRWYITEPTLLIRVSPANAKLSTDMISLINSQGNELGLVSVSKIEPYKGDILTRAAVDNTGLYTVTFKLKEDFTAAAFTAATVSAPNKIVYAVAIKNNYVNGEDADGNPTTNTRRVISEYDLTLTTNVATPGNLVNTWVAGTDGWKKLGSAASTLADPGLANRYLSIPTVDDYTWAAAATTAQKLGNVSPIPAAALATDAADNRYENPMTPKFAYLNAQVGEPIKIKIDYTLPTDANPANKIKGFYVTLDERYANVNDPSELNAWNSYDYEGVGYMSMGVNQVKPTVFEGNEGEIVIKNQNLPAGDIIGFRIYAINLDGTLLDPDGKAFYVAVNGESKNKEVTVNVTAKAGAWASTATVEIPNWNNPNFATLAWAAYATNDAQTATLAQARFDEDASKSLAAAQIRYSLFSTAANAATPTVAAAWQNARSIKIELNNAANFLDDATYSFTLVGRNADGVVVNTLKVNVKKVMPNTSAAAGFSWKVGQLTNGEYHCYLDPVKRADVTPADWRATAIVANGVKDLVAATNGMENDGLFKWNFKNPTITVNGDNTSLLGNAWSYWLTVPIAQIDNKTAHEVTIGYDAGNISTTDASDPTKQAQPYNVPIETRNVYYCCALNENTQKYAWNTTNTNNYYTIDYNTNTVIKAYGTRNSDGTFANYRNQYHRATGFGLSTLADRIIATNSYNNSQFGGALNKNFYRNYIVALTSVNEDGVDTGREEYYDVTFDGTDFTFTMRSGATNPAANSVKCILHLKGQDRFGHTHNIANLDFYIIKR